jgi:hypothetical protein
VSTEVPAFRAAVVKRIDKQDDGCVPNALPASASVIRRRAVDILDVGRPVVIVSNNEHITGADAITDSNHALAEHVRHSPATG